MESGIALEQVVEKENGWWSGGGGEDSSREGTA